MEHLDPPACVRGSCRAAGWRLALALAAGVTLLGSSCRPAGPPPTAPPAAPVEPSMAEPELRVGIAVDTPSVVLSADQGAEITGPGAQVLAAIRPTEQWTVVATPTGGIEARGEDGGRAVSPEGPVFVLPRPDGTIRIGDTAYRGAVTVSAAANGRVTAVNIVELEEYLLGVVPAEIPSIEVEAVKAQAVAARTYAVRNLGRRADRGFDLYATVADQVYRGIDIEDPVATEAVHATRGEILTYRNSPIRAYYHSTCGGRTAAIDEVWNEPPVPYLVSVSDEVPGTGGYYCERSNRFRWTERWAGPELARILGQALSAQMGARFDGTAPSVQDVRVRGHTPSGRAAALEIDANGERFVVRGDSIRWILRPEPERILNSTLFTLETMHEAGEVDRLEAHGGGWGHGIGMCQMGAIGRAAAGQRYREILTAYYRGAAVTRVY